jgi:ribonuclease HI
VSLVYKGIVNTPTGVCVQVIAPGMATFQITLAEATTLSNDLARGLQAYGQQQVNLQQDYLVSTDASFNNGAAVGAIHVFGKRVGTWIKRFRCATCLHAELETIAFAFEHVKRGSRVTVYTDSEQAVNLLTKWPVVKEPVAAEIVARIKQSATDKHLTVQFVWKPRASPEIQRVHNLGQRAAL